MYIRFSVMKLFSTYIMIFANNFTLITRNIETKLQILYRHLDCEIQRGIQMLDVLAGIKNFMRLYIILANKR